ncbi:response regulator [bacterium]|nr:response regulator [bacterium]
MEKQGAKLTRVLICDDDPADRKLIKRILIKIRDRKFKITEAERKCEIEKALAEQEFDLILLDMAMPEKSGKLWLSEIVDKEIAPVIVITGHGELEDSFEAMRHGAYAYISKNWLCDFELGLSTIKRTVLYTLDQWKLECDLDEQLKSLNGKANILICDDDPGDIRIIRSYLNQLKKLDVNIDEATDCDQIENSINSNKYDVIFMDHSMPHKSGIEWAEEILKRKVAPVIMITSHGSEELAVEALKIGISDYISKDLLSANRLYKALCAVL